MTTKGRGRDESVTFDPPSGSETLDKVKSPAHERGRTPPETRAQSLGDDEPVDAPTRRLAAPQGGEIEVAREERRRGRFHEESERAGGVGTEENCIESIELPATRVEDRRCGMPTAKSNATESCATPQARQKFQVGVRVTSPPH